MLQGPKPLFNVWLKDTISGRCYFPGGDGFQFQDFEEHTYTLVVEGAPPAADRYVNDENWAV